MYICSSFHFPKPAQPKTKHCPGLFERRDPATTYVRAGMHINQLHAVGEHPLSDKLLSVICARIPTNPNSVLLVFSVLSLLAVRQVAHISRTSSVYSLKRGQLVSCIHSVLVSVCTYVCIYMYAYNILGIT